jgi:hypothetical protein
MNNGVKHKFHSTMSARTVQSLPAHMPMTKSMTAGAKPLSNIAMEMN